MISINVYAMELPLEKWVSSFLLSTENRYFRKQQNGENLQIYQKPNQVGDMQQSTSSNTYIEKCADSASSINNVSGNWYKVLKKWDVDELEKRCRPNENMHRKILNSLESCSSNFHSWRQLQHLQENCQPLLLSLKPQKTGTIMRVISLFIGSGDPKLDISHEIFWKTANE